MSKLNQIRTEFFQQIKADLTNLDNEAFALDFAPDGKPISESAKAWLESCKSKVARTFSQFDCWYLAPLFETKDLADFAYWERSEFLSLDEIVWLSVGLEPTSEFISKISPSDRFQNKQKLDAVGEYMSRHKETIRRKIDPHNRKHKPDLRELAEWIEAVDLKVHPQFKSILPIAGSNSESTAPIQVTQAPSDQMDGREKTSMAKLIAAMAIDCYGYDPKARRSDIPNEIQGIADRLGLGLSSDTIRKYLKRGSELVPDDWKPE
ncbi:hypothetical protein [Sulfitobacter mediterraneus]|uniref:hypothetical protein n=1 Tax=Sulfitobacter mediterraneus TaxID=83219 RepID=UPI0013C4AB7B|nr:hypothetical protein [Sulfitobacter mediterraneus]